VFQCGGTPGIGSGAIAATALPFFCAIEETASSPTGCSSWVRPNNAV
jgi:hypothetical protein